MNRSLYKRRIGVLLTAGIFVLIGCGTKTEQQTDNVQHTPGSQTMPMSQTPPAVQDVSTEALVKVDPDIQKYEDAVVTAKNAYDKSPTGANKKIVINAYAAFGDYMQYESPVSPRKGKYRRALMEYRHALKLDPTSEKIQREIQQIEDIYRSMNRPVPMDDGA